jgi:hypothetical protein
MNGLLIFTIAISTFLTSVSAHAWTLTGSPIYNSTGKTGRIYVSFVDPYNNAVAGASAANGTTSATVRGVPTGSYSLKGFVDSTGTGYQHANDPVPIPYGLFPVSGSLTAPVTFTLPTPVSAVAPPQPNVIPFDSAAFVTVNGPKSLTGLPIADSYTIYWSTTPNPSSTNKIGMIAGITTLQPKHLILGLTNNTAYYFAVEAFVNGGGSALSPAAGPITVNTPAATTSNVTVTVDTTGIPKTSSIPLLVAITDDNNSMFMNYVATQSDIQTVTVPGVAKGTYKTYVILIRDVSGNIDSLSNVSNLNDKDLTQRPLPIMVDGVTSSISAPQVKLSLRSASSSIRTIHSKQYQGTDSYGLQISASQMGRQLVNASLDSGPQISEPIDLPINQNSDRPGQLDSSRIVAIRPAIGDQYSLTLQYASGLPEIMTAKVTAVLDNFPGNTFPVGSIGPANLAPTFSWINPGNLTGFMTSSVSINNFNAEFLPMSTLTIPYSGSLTAGQTYYWNRTVQDYDGNQATTNGLSFTPSANASGPVITDFNPKSAAAGTSVTITGTGFDPQLTNYTGGTPTSFVYFNGTVATVTAAGATSLTVTAPASSGIITVATGGIAAGSSASFAATTTYTVTLTDAINGSTLLTTATATQIENPAISTSTNTSGVYVLTIPARPYYSLLFTQSGYQPTYSALLSATSTASSGFSLYTAAELTSRGVTMPMPAGKGVLASRVQDDTFNSAINLAGATVTATSLMHPDTPYTVSYTNNTKVIDVTKTTATAADGRYYVLNVDDGDYVTISATKAGMGFQSRVFNIRGGAVGTGSIKGATASTPIADFKGGIYYDPLPPLGVTLSATNYDNIFYTTDGSDPTFNGTQYSTPISISSTTTLKFVAKNKTIGQAIGPVQTEVYDIRQLPAIYSFDPSGGRPGTTVVIYGSGFDEVTPANNIVIFPGSNTPAPVISCLNGKLTVTVPADAVAPNSAPITVTTADNPTTFSSSAFSVTLPATISGSVKTPGSGATVSGVTISLFGNTLVAAVQTDSSGNFSISGVPTNTYFTLKASKPGYNDNYFNYWTAGDASWVIVDIYDNVSYANSLQNSPGTGIIRVKVMNSIGDTSLAGATASANFGPATTYGSSTLPGSPPDSSFSATSTPASGIFYIKNILVPSPGPVQINVSLAGYSFQTQYIWAYADSTSQLTIYDQTPNHSLTLGFSPAQTGFGTVTSNPQVNGSISCRPGSPSGCNASYVNGKTVTLSPVADSGSIFTTWAICDSLLGNVCSVTMWNDKSIQASFSADTSLPCFISGTNIYRSSLQGVYDYFAANGPFSQGEFIQLKSGQLDGDFVANSNVTVTIKGGYDTGFGNVNNSMTTLHILAPPLAIKNGKIIFEKINIK